MPLSISDRHDPTESGSDIEVTEVDTPPSLREKIQNATTSAVERLSGVVATEMRPEARAGVELSKIVLRIVSGTILFFGTYLFVIDILGRINLGEAYKHVYMQIENNRDVIDSSDIIFISEKFRKASLDDTLALSDDEIKAVQNFVKNIFQAKIISESQKNSLNNCTPFPSTERTKSLPDCADLLDTARRGAAASALSYEKIKLLTDFTKNLDDHQRSFQSFWLQVAQLILLNLLLPLLTGLFGYIFGTTQQNSGAAKNQ